MLFMQTRQALSDSYRYDKAKKIQLFYRFQVLRQKYVKTNYPAYELRSYCWFFSKILLRPNVNHLLNTFVKKCAVFLYHLQNSSVEDVQ